jgi:hypothetical protein
LAYSLAVKVEAMCSSETSIDFEQTTYRYTLARKHGQIFYFCYVRFWKSHLNTTYHQIGSINLRFSQLDLCRSSQAVINLNEGNSNVLPKLWKTFNILRGTFLKVEVTIISFLFSFFMCFVFTRFAFCLMLFPAPQRKKRRLLVGDLWLRISQGLFCSDIRNTFLLGRSSEL